jgi:monovalent cation/proton antiporter MnhG/PhaG subunit
MMVWISALFLVGGAALCLVAAVGVLRLPDFFLRMHAATEAGVAGCGLLLIGVGFAYPSVEMWTKVLIAVAFLLLTTPIAGHLLARAGYVAGVPLWSGTADDQLESELGRGDFERRSMTSAVTSTDRAPVPRRNGVIVKIVVGLTNGPDRDQMIRHAVFLAREHGAELTGLAIVDSKRLTRIGPVPIGGSYYAARLRNSLIEKARHSVAEVVQCFEQAAIAADVRFSVAMEEGDPAEILARRQGPGTLVLVGRRGWFDHGVNEMAIDPLPHLVRHGVWPVIAVAASPERVLRVVFVHDGSVHSDRTWKWLLKTAPWPGASLRLVPDGACREGDLANARAIAQDMAQAIEEDHGGNLADTIREAQVVVFGNEGHSGWINSVRAAARPRLDGAPVVVFG